MTNVIQFPHARTGGHRKHAPCHNAMARDFLAIANYLDTVADDSGWRLWVTGMASEMRTMAQNLKGG